MGLVQAENIQVHAESYDVALDMSFPKGAMFGLFHLLHRPIWYHCKNSRASEDILLERLFVFLCCKILSLQCKVLSRGTHHT